MMKSIKYSLFILNRSWSFMSRSYEVLHLSRKGISSSSTRERVSKVPQQPVTTSIKEKELPPKTNVDLKLVQLLEKLSLVDFANKEGVARLEAAIDLADKLSVVDTDGVEPMITVLEDRSLPLADDEVTTGDMSEELLGCAVKTLEDYFVVPPGNIDFAQDEEYYHKLGENKEKKAV
ncbi:glutamyl-tRNA(Gln) amidotransferase subunit C, mitochondrial-like [Penaeus monodon]|uniref:glutamyl-tRNA(Gln) amidotransferase subunit C, mitochondrial-like n=1 Tax=Penaeus monodon TaxID=6687 RepID=UPI0018A7AA38|nr:glutamyl-tRNA(Gln) amidotransferase subunit C, mitochondrial-like [Penaeus monodon]XP_037783848.1 glutamyl-tRNA(Gln) amidotransferase subunit C, mitochondrial-like [Penaeus monodon]XP_037783849.1 glutamyl-tRNA(Gln) amidotransferase subunit C, mitochondrial-like [Penaeus monodon]XP_037783850.1 glutamyl-tRNA(Gln) amidotransferase subunit C, mitochondrial-like [Penaeus monodon]XP_037783851.1 glutamyl-tRNA(Gln) amidotransferase subunit C, mitochondrial-like [Penaeus monodon]